MRGAPPSDALLTQRREALRSALGSAMERGVADRWTEADFNALALDVFRYQADANPIYGNFVRNRGIDSDALTDWREIPAVPARAFKEVSLLCGDPTLVEATFLTSGTTRGGGARGRHKVRDLSLYRASLLPMARAYLLPDAGPLRLIALLPPPESHPESSLVHMAGVLKEEWDDGRGGFFADSEWALDFEGIERAVHDARQREIPTLLLGTAFAFVHWLDRTDGGPCRHLPSGSVVMETGGYKGRSREVPRGELYSTLAERLAIPLNQIVNEYGMTEMLSQFYEPVLRRRDPTDVKSRWHEGPPWVRTRILDPGNLAEVPTGEPGLLCHLDLANLDSVSAILTEDWGIEAEGGFRVLGRLLEAEPRGCSLSMEELLMAREKLRGARP